MKILSTTLRTLTCTIFIFALSSLAQAQASRTWVSGVGDDLNPCSRTAPCKTFAGAISKTANGGEIDTLDSGGFGAVTIGKSITIDGQGTLAGILAAGTNGVTVNATATDRVSLRNLSINGGPTTAPGPGLIGVRILVAKAVSIDSCYITNFLSSAANSGRGINDVRTTANGSLFVNDTIIRYSGNAGIVVAPGVGGAVKASLSNVRVEQSGENGTGTGMVFSGSTVSANVAHSVITKNATFGIGVESGAKLFIDNSWVTLNGTTGLDANAAASTVRMSNTVISGNGGAGLGLSGGAIRSYGNNMIRGNNPDTNPTNTDLPQ
jgi:hypothetical protein